MEQMNKCRGCGFNDPDYGCTCLRMKNGMLAQLKAKNLKIFKNLKIMLNGGGIENEKNKIQINNCNRLQGITL